MLETIAKYIQDVSVLRRLLFAAKFLAPDIPQFLGLVVEFATVGKTSASSITPEQARVFVENLECLNTKAFDTDQDLFKELMQMEIPGKIKRLGVPLISANDTCITCNSPLLTRKDRPASVVLYDDSIGVVPAAHFHKICSRRGCSFCQYYGYYTTGSTSSCQAVYNSDWQSLPYFVSSKETAFSTELLRRLDAEIVIGQMSYKQRADIYNYVHCNTSAWQLPPTSVNTLMERHSLDRRRLEHAHFQYALLRVFSWYNFDLPKYPLHEATHETLLQVTGTYYGAFMKKYSDHRCQKAGCGSVLVLDGNMKNSREVCSAKLAGYCEYAGLPGKIQTGCPNTPVPKSRYCLLHAPVAAVPQKYLFNDDMEVPIVTKQPSNEERHAAIIINKRVTRQSTYYQVVWLGEAETDSTWEEKASLPTTLVSNYEAGVVVEIGRDSSAAGGTVVHTLTTKEVPSMTEQPPNKRHKVDVSDVISETTSTFAMAEHDIVLKCNTEKDSHGRLNYRTAGILAGVWPCGVILMLGELFGAESKSQVYGYLHSFLHENQDSSSNIRIICYDDGCHLKKYAMNPTRSNLTPIASRIAKTTIVIDRMHFKGHTDRWCQEHCDPTKIKDLDKVNTEICEQTFSWLSRYSRITRSMNRHHFLFFLLYISDIHNQRLLQ